jgi:hypothetical protein
MFLNGERMVYATYDEFISQVLTAIDPALTPQPQSEDPEVVGEAAGESVRFGI